MKTLWYRICVATRALPDSVRLIVYFTAILGYVWLAAYIFRVWPWTSEWCWWYIPQACSVGALGCIIIFSEVLGL